MTLEEAKKLAKIIATADGGCAHCVADLAEQMNAAFPEFVWSLHEWYSETERVEVHVAEPKD